MEVPRMSSTDARASSFRKLRCPSLNAVRLRRTFDLFDKNHDGIITIDELSEAFTCLGWDADCTDLENMLKSHIKPGNKGLEYEEFEALYGALNDAMFGGMDDVMEKENDVESSDMKEAFKVFDENGDGYISARELSAVLKKLGLSEDSQMDRVEKMICSVDRNKDGRVDFAEFKDMMHNVIAPSQSQPKSSSDP